MSSTTRTQQAALMLHRARDRLIRQRTQLTNAFRAHLAELGLVSPTDVDGLKAAARRRVAGRPDEAVPRYGAAGLEDVG